MEKCIKIMKSTLESGDKILFCEHSNKTSSTLLFHGTICFSIFFRIKIWDFSLILLFWHFWISKG